MAAIDDALIELKRKVQDMSDPVLSAPELDSLLKAALRAKPYTTTTAFGYGDYVYPTARNGHRYKCVQSGTTGILEPVWPLQDFGTMIDGSCRWEEAGADYSNSYDVRQAVREGWLLKAAKASERTNFSTPGGRFDAEQVYKHCIEMAARYAPLTIA